MNLRRLLVPSVSTFLWLAFFLALSLANWRLVLINADGDPALHWRVGNWMIDHREIIRADPFSHTRAAAPVITKEWLSEVLFAAAGRALGWNGFVLPAAALVATVLWGLHRHLLARGCELLLATGLVLAAAFAMAHHWLARPHLFTHLFALLYIVRLRDFDRGGLPASRLFLWLIPAMVLWVNLHGAFFVGFVLIGCALITRRGHQPRLQLLGLLAGCAAVSLLNPNGWQLHAHIVEFIRSPALTGYTNEFRSPNFHSGGMQGFLLLLALLTLLLTVVRPRLTAYEITSVAVWGYLALHSVRNVPVFALVTVPILADRFQAWLASRTTVYRDLSARLTAPSRAAGGGLLVALAVAALLGAAVQGWPRTEMLRDRFPVAAVEFLAQTPEPKRGRLFNDYAWSGYLLLALPAEKVFVDSRNDFYGAELMQEFDTVDEVRPGWEAVVERYGVGWTILPATHALNSLLELQPARWRELYRDDVARVFVRRAD